MPIIKVGSDHEPLIAKFRLKFKKVGKTTRPFRYDLNQIPYSYIAEVTNRFKGLDLIECLTRASSAKTRGFHTQLDKWPVTSRTTREARGVPSSRKDEA